MIDDQKAMLRAVELAQKGRGQVWPNPPVGAVIVRDGVIIGEGWHKRSGTLHAERVALADAAARGNDVRGASIYVTLEPCSTRGRTGACTDALITAGISRCVYAVQDPNSAHAGAADALLAAANVSVDLQPLPAAEALIRGFRSLQTRGRPWVIAKSAQSLDGKITRPPGEGQWLTGEEARLDVQSLRREVNAIVTSGETFRNDAPQLNLRVEVWNDLLADYAGSDLAPHQPLRAVMSRNTIASDWLQLGDDPARALQTLGERGVTTVLLEAGGELLGAFADAGLVDEWVLYLAPLVAGGDRPGIAGLGAETISAATTLDDISYFRHGDDVCLRGLVRR